MIEQAFVLAGGKGERLRPLTNGIPKPMVKVKEKPILQYNIELLVKHGVKEIILGTGYMHEKIGEYFKDGAQFGASIVYSVETQPLGTGGALKQAEELLAENFFMMNGDNISDFDLKALAEMHFSKEAGATLALVEVDDVSSYGVARLEGEKITEFIEKPSKEEAPSNLVNAGCYAISKKSLELLPEEFNLIEKTMFPQLAERGKLYSYIHKGYWFTTDTIERLKRAEEGL